MRDFLCAEDLLIDPDECGEDTEEDAPLTERSPVPEGCEEEDLTSGIRDT